MKVFGFALPKAVVAVVSTMLGVGVVTTGVIATVPQARIGLQGTLSIVRRIPAIGPAAGLTYRVEGPSMEPAYTSGDNITLLPLVDGQPKPRDVVAFQYAPDIIYLKRVVAAGPATVTWTASGVKVDDQSACSTYLHGGSAVTGSKTLGAGQYFVVGDNLPYSADSRSFGPIARASIVGYLPG